MEIFLWRSVSSLVGFFLSHRYYSICSNWVLFHAEVDFLYHYYSTNQFPATLFWRTVRKFLNRIMTPHPASYNVPKDRQFVSLPFFGHQSYIVRNKLLSLFRIHFPQIDVKIVLSNRVTIGSFFRVKERLPTSLCSNVVYKYSCASGDCKSSYIGSSGRTLRDRICEHKGISYRTGMTLTVPPFSAVREHSTSCAHPIDDESFKIIGGCRKGDDLRLLESIYIKHCKPTLNLTESAEPLFIT